MIINPPNYGLIRVTIDVMEISSINNYSIYSIENIRN